VLIVQKWSLKITINIEKMGITLDVVDRNTWGKKRSKETLK
jgi:hypothetical protein